MADLKQGPQNTEYQKERALHTAIKYEPRMSADGRIVLRPVHSSVKFLSNDGIILTVHLRDIDLSQIGAVFIFPISNDPTARPAGDPLSSLPPRLGQILSQSATPLCLYTEYVAYVTATELPKHEGPAPALDIVAEQQAHIAMRTMASQQPPPADPDGAYGHNERQQRAMMDVLGRQLQSAQQQGVGGVSHKFPYVVAASPSQFPTKHQEGTK